MSWVSLVMAGGNNIIMYQIFQTRIYVICSVVCMLYSMHVILCMFYSVQLHAVQCDCSIVVCMLYSPHTLQCTIACFQVCIPYSVHALQCTTIYSIVYNGILYIVHTLQFACCTVPSCMLYTVHAHRLRLAISSRLLLVTGNNTDRQGCS